MLSKQINSNLSSLWRAKPKYNPKLNLQTSFRKLNLTSHDYFSTKTHPINSQLIGLNSFKEFHNLDEIDNKSRNFLIDSMEYMESLESVRVIQASSAEDMINLIGQEKISVLEAGCGLGQGAKIIRDTGIALSKNIEVIGVDLSREMIRRANNNYKDHKITFLHKDIMDLSLLNSFKNRFDGCRAERLLVSCKDYKNLFAAMLQLVKPGGVISITDVDAATIVLCPKHDTNKTFLSQLLEGFVNPDMGRELPNLFSEFGLTDINITPNISTINSLEGLYRIFPMQDIINFAVKSGKTTYHEFEQWLGYMQAANRTGTFLYTIIFFTVIGRKPKV